MLQPLYQAGPYLAVYNPSNSDLDMCGFIFLPGRNLDAGSLGLVKGSDGHLGPTFLLSFNAVVLSTWSEVAAGAPAVAFVPHVESGNGKIYSVISWHLVTCLYVFARRLGRVDFQLGTLPAILVQVIKGRMSEYVLDRCKVFKHFCSHIP